MTFHVWIVQPYGYPHARCFEEVARGFAGVLRSLGHDVLEPERTTGVYVTNALARGGERAIVFGGHLLPDTPLPPDAILFNLEQATLDDPRWFQSDYLRMLRRHEVWDYSRANVDVLREMGVGDIKLCRIGAGATAITPACEDVDVLHYGSLTPRRQSVLESLAREGLRVEHIFCLYGEERDRWIARAKIVLNVHAYEKKSIWEVVRCSHLLANKKCVVSEADGADLELETLAARATAYVPYKNIVPTCLALTSDATGRHAVAERGFQTISAIDQVADVKRALETT